VRSKREEDSCLEMFLRLDCLKNAKILNDKMNGMYHTKNYLAYKLHFKIFGKPVKGH